MLKKWGSSVYLGSAWRRGYVEALRLLDLKGHEEERDAVPEEVLRFLREHQDPDYDFHVECEGDVDALTDAIIDAMSWEGFKVMEMFARYFWSTEEERRRYDNGHIERIRARMLQRLEYVQNGIADYLRDCRERGTAFAGLDPRSLRRYPVGCVQTLAVLDTLIPQYRERIPKEYLWILGMSGQKGYHYRFEAEREDGTFEVKEPPIRETWGILADISRRYWEGFRVAPEEIEVELSVIPWGEE